MAPTIKNKPDWLSRLNKLLKAEMPRGNNSLAVAANYHFKNPGKLFRAQLAISTGTALNLDDKENLHWAAACELLHNASLIHDDISDASEYRRGQKSVCAQFGNDMALCLGDWMIAKSFELAARHPLHGSKLVALLAQSMQDTCIGQTADIHRNRLSTVSCWQDIARNKTAPLLIAPVLGAAIIAGRDSNSEALIHIIDLCGLAYQGLNDIDDIIPSSHRSADLWGRKPNLVISLFAESVSSGDEFSNWYHSDDCSRVAQWQQRIASSEAILLAHQQVEAWLAEANQANQLQSPPLRTVVNQLIQTVTPKANPLANQGYIA